MYVCMYVCLQVNFRTRCGRQAHACLRPLREPKGNLERHVLRAGSVRPRHRFRRTSTARAVPGRDFHLLEPVFRALRGRRARSGIGRRRLDG